MLAWLLALQNQTAIGLKFPFFLKGNNVFDKTNFLHNALPGEDSID